jgi:CBS domain containing-hemolysin-like protein
LTLRGIERVSLMMAGAQLGITMCSLGLGAVGEPAVAHQLEKPLGALGIEGAWLHGISFAIALSIVVWLHMVLGEMVPKNIAIAGPERTALILGPILYVIVTGLKPFIWTLNSVSNGVLRLLKVTPREEVASTVDADSVASLIMQSRDEGLIDPTEQLVMTGAIQLSIEKVEAVMVPLAKVVSLPLDTSPRTAREMCIKHGFSRFPVADSNGELTGYIHLKDFARATRGDGTKAIPADAIRPLATIEASASLESALTAMQVRGTHLALVVSDGEPVGMAMLEDVVERLVGEVVDAGQAVARATGR